jgi:hypothetical protein
VFCVLLIIMEGSGEKRPKPHGAGTPSADGSRLAGERQLRQVARYGLMLAEQMGDDFIRASLLKLVRAWLAAAKEIEKAANNVLVEIAAGP